MGLTSGKSALVNDKRDEFCKNEMLDSKDGGMATLDGEFKNSKLVNIINTWNVNNIFHKFINVLKFMYLKMLSENTQDQTPLETNCLILGTKK